MSFERGLSDFSPCLFRFDVPSQKPSFLRGIRLVRFSLIMKRLRAAIGWSVALVQDGVLLRPGRRPRRPRGRGLSSGAVGFRLLIGRRNKPGHAIDKTLRSLDRLLRALGGYLRAGVGLIVGKFFEIEGAAKERSQINATRGSSFTSRRNSFCARRWLLVISPVVSKIKARAA
jgi:hypothetical protein